MHRGATLFSWALMGTNLLDFDKVDTDLCRLRSTRRELLRQLSRSCR